MRDDHTPHSDPGFLPDKGVDNSVIWMMAGALFAVLFLLTIIGMAQFTDPMRAGESAAKQSQQNQPGGQRSPDSEPAPTPHSDIGPLAQ